MPILSLESPALLRAAADLIVALHAAFVAFVVLGGLFVVRWPRLAWVHVPAAVWGAVVEFAGWICPLTPFEIWLRQRGGAAGYEGDFIERYVLPVLYPAQLTRGWQLALGSFVVLINVFLYWHVARRAARGRVSAPN